MACLNFGTLGGWKLGIVELGSWKTTYSLAQSALIETGGFLGDAEHLYVETQSFGRDNRLVQEQMAINLADGQVSKRLAPVNLKEATTRYYPLSHLSLLGFIWNRGPVAWTKVSLPDYKEIARIPWPADGRTLPPQLLPTELSVSSDRQTFVYSVDHSIVCRSAKDLGVLWTREIGSQFGSGSRVTSQPNGRVVAIVIEDQHNVAGRLTGTYYADILDGKDGALLKRFPLGGDSNVALSWGGKLLAVGCPVANSEGTMQGAQIFDIESERLLTTAIRERYYGREYRGPSCLFTPGDKYLVVASDKTSFWSLDGPG